MTVTPEQVKDFTNRLLTIADFIVKITPNDTDDKIKDFVSNVVTQDWFVGLVVLALSKFAHKPNDEELKKFVVEHLK